MTLFPASCSAPGRRVQVLLVSLELRPPGDSPGPRPSRVCDNIHRCVALSAAVLLRGRPGLCFL